MTHEPPHPTPSARRSPRPSAAAVHEPAPWLLFAALALWAGCTGDQEIEVPTPLYGQTPIDYPLELWDQDLEGRTLLKVRVTEVGSVDSVIVVESSGHGAFDSAAIAGARELRFSPARRNGKRIEVWAQVPVYFSKRPAPPE